MNQQINTIDLIRTLYQRRTAWHRGEKTLTLQGKAICRRICDGDKTAGGALFDTACKLNSHQIAEILANGHADANFAKAVIETHPLIISRAIVEKNREALEQEYETLVYDLPIMEWAGKIRGIGPGSIAAIIGSTGNLWNYPTVQKFWNRMGMAVMPDGRRQRNLSGQSAADRVMGGYNAQRRSVVWNIGTSIMFAQTQRTQKDEDGAVIGIKREAGDYRLIYDRRRAYEEAKNEAGDYAPLAKAILVNSAIGKTTVAYKAYKEGKLPPGHLKARAQRYMEKELLKRLWVEWRICMGDAKPSKEEIEERSLARRTA